MTAVSTSQRALQSINLAETPVVAPFHADSLLVAAMPTSIVDSTAGYAVDENGGNTNDDDPGHVTAIPGDTAPNSAAFVGHRGGACAGQSCPSLHEGCKGQEAVAAVSTTRDAAAHAGAHLTAVNSESIQAPKGNSPATKQQPVAMQSAHMQPCKEILQTLDMFDETEQCRHRQASKAALRVLAIQEQRLLWAAKSKGGGERTLPAWIHVAADHSLS